MCAIHDITGALTLVMSDAKWDLMPINLTNPVNVANGQQPVYRTRPAYPEPTAHTNNAASAVVKIHRLATTRHNDFTFASSTLTTALLASIGAANTDILRTTFPNFAPYMLTPIMIMETMANQHGVTTGDDVSKLLSPLSQPLTSLTDLTKHMSSFLLASQRLTRSGQGETAYKYFKMFLETVASFPSIGMCLTTYYTAHPLIANQSVASLFPYLETMKDHLLKADPNTPFSGLAQQPGLTRKQRRDRANAANQLKNKGKDGGGNKTNQRTPRWSPQGPTLLAATAATTTPAPTDYTPYLAEIQRLQCALAAHTGSYQPGADFGMPVALQATSMPSDRPREFYCWLHGWNNTPHGTNCKIMGANTAYTPTMKSATGPTNTGGYPKVGVPVHLDRPHFTFFCSRPPCVPCLPSTPPFLPQTPPIPSPASSSAKQCVLPHEATRARPAILATLLFKQAEGPLSCPQDDTRSRPATIVVSLSEKSEGHTHQPYEDTKASSARKTIAPHMLSKSEGNNTRVRDASSPTPSSPFVTMSVLPSIFSLPASIPNPHTQHHLRLDPPPIIPSRFASINRFDVLSDLDVSPPAPVEPPEPHPPLLRH